MYCTYNIKYITRPVYCERISFSKMKIEVCVDSVESAVSAERGGASRVELCTNLSEGGTTPTAGMLAIMKQILKIPIFVMIRPRGGDFCFSDQEFEVMKIDVKQLKEYGADGIVIGILTREGTVDVDRCQVLIDIGRPLEVTFHRAIDMAAQIEEALETVITLGCERVLTSGGENTALEGSPMIRKLIEQVAGRIKIMPGGGITERNVRRIIEETGAIEFHASARSSRDSVMTFRNARTKMGASYGPSEYSLSVTDKDRVKTLLRTARESV